MGPLTWPSVTCGLVRPQRAHDIFFPSTVLIKTSQPLAWQFISCLCLWQPGAQSEETIRSSADLPVVGFCSGWSGHSLLVFSVTVSAGGAREGSALLMRPSLIKHQQVSYAKHQHKSMLRQFASSFFFASEDFCFSAWANLPVTPHLQQVIILDSVTSAAHRRYLAERVGERRADAPPPRLSFKAAALNGDEARTPPTPCAFLSFPRARKCLRRLKWSRRRLGSGRGG